MTSHTEIPDEIVEKAAKAIFFDQHIIMHDHEKNWRKANQVIWLSAARAALSAVAPMLRAQGMREALKLAEETLDGLIADDSPYKVIEALRARAADLEGGKG